ncbi:myb family transcription factor PHL8-like isoform X3 [Salvia miltiorrhiza]|uniref:myb family transcription factor PHL8-like isoform X3 n=1 Tax=Salvia miltiorrhiza TaxID=226208 RepID=UPI0025ACC64C|nr:myb family transcription factor PHL8-like isoform X3 [Salvia miltiorrhiza]
MMCRFAEALRMQMEVQRKLEQKMEVQRHLQMRIEAQGRYLQSVLNKAKETQHHLLHSASDHSSLSKAKQKDSEMNYAGNRRIFSKEDKGIVCAI